MQVILPVAGFGTRMRPHTWSRPKPLLHVAGNTVLGHTLDKFESIDVDEIIFITGWLGDQIQEYVESNYSFQTRYVVQETMEGQAHAIHLAKEHISGPCLVIFVDTIFEADLSILNDNPADGVIYVQEVDDPRAFGVVVEEQGRVTRYVEKPESLENRKATVGVFWFKDGQELISAIDHMLEQDIRTKGEYYLADAINVMIERGHHFVTEGVSVWQDCGQTETTLETNRFLLSHGHATEGAQGENCVIIPPVHVAPSARLRNAVIGPHVSIAANAQISSSIVRDSIVDEGAQIENSLLEGSIIGQRAVVKGQATQLNIGDDASAGS
jgi:glucose-1-phosphate thymidylyltransferase